MSHRPASQSKKPGYSFAILGLSTLFSYKKIRFDNLVTTKELIPGLSVDMIDFSTLIIYRGEVKKINDKLGIDIIHPRRPKSIQDGKLIPVGNILNVEKVNGKYYYNSKIDVKTNYIEFNGLLSLLPKILPGQKNDLSTLLDLQIYGGASSKNIAQKCKMLGYSIYTNKDFRESLVTEMMLSNVTIAVSPRGSVVILSPNYIRCSLLTLEKLTDVAGGKPVKVSGLNVAKYKPYNIIIQKTMIVGPIKCNSTETVGIMDGRGSLDLSDIKAPLLKRVNIHSSNFDVLNISSINNKKVSIDLGDINVGTLIIPDNCNISEYSFYSDLGASWGPKIGKCVTKSGRVIDLCK